jgi:hypothetical protein
MSVLGYRPEPPMPYADAPATGALPIRVGIAGYRQHVESRAGMAELVDAAH